VRLTDGQVLAAATRQREVVDYGEKAFAGLSVQSVGYERGADKPKVHVYVTKGAARALRNLSQVVGGVEVEVDKVGLITIRPEAAASKATNHGHVFERRGRICCGSSCAPTSEDSTGTLGALVRKVGQADLYALSNNHVFGGCNHVPVDTPILSPGSMDGRAGVRAPSSVARHSEIHELRTGDPNFVEPCPADVAIARVENPDVLTSWQGNDADGYDTPTAVRDPVSRMRVKKFGRTTGLTMGTVQSFAPTPTPIGYNAKYFKGTVWFKNIWYVRSDPGQPFALPGDSGSLVVTEDGSEAVGLVFAASPAGDFGLLIPLPCAVGYFGRIELVSNHGT
jgi:hypothetical protein